MEATESKNGEAVIVEIGQPVQNSAPQENKNVVPVTYHENFKIAETSRSGFSASLHLYDDATMCILSFDMRHTSSNYHLTREAVESIRDRLNEIIPLMQEQPKAFDPVRNAGDVVA